MSADLEPLTDAEIDLKLSRPCPCELCVNTRRALVELKRLRSENVRLATGKRVQHDKHNAERRRADTLAVSVSRLIGTMSEMYSTIKDLAQRYETARDERDLYKAELDAVRAKRSGT